jgi:hypothetical protein
MRDEPQLADACLGETGWVLDNPASARGKSLQAARSANGVYPQPDHTTTPHQRRWRHARPARVAAGKPRVLSLDHSLTAAPSTGGGAGMSG